MSQTRSRAGTSSNSGGGVIVADDPKEYLFKILVIGDVGTGKTSIIKRYVHNFFSQHYKATIGVDFALKLIVWDANTIVRMQMWDVAGQERFGNITRVYYKDAAGALVVFDSTRSATLEGAIRWKNDLDQKVRLADGRPIPTVLIANKCDLDESVHSDVDLARYCDEYGFIAAFRTSAKENIGIDDACRALTTHVLSIKKAGQYELPIFQQDGNVRRLTNNNHHIKSSAGGGQSTRNATDRSCCSIS